MVADRAADGARSITQCVLRGAWKRRCFALPQSGIAEDLVQRPAEVIPIASLPYLARRCLGTRINRTGHVAESKSLHELCLAGRSA
jgi:hypothetical protein